jgi:hypothetical protein
VADVVICPFWYRLVDSLFALEFGPGFDLAPDPDREFGLAPDPDLALARDPALCLDP